MEKLGLIVLTIVALTAIQVPENSNQNAWHVSGKVTSADDGKAIIGAIIREKGTSTQATTDKSGAYSITVNSPDAVLVFKYPGFKTREIKVSNRQVINVKMRQGVMELQEEVQVDMEIKGKYGKGKQAEERMMMPPSIQGYATGQGRTHDGFIEHNTESYSTIHENIFHEPRSAPLSTFAIDVDAASYSNIRRFLNMGSQPPKDAVRIEEMINYFNYEYPQPDGEDPFSVTTEVSSSPWNEQHLLVHIGLQGLEIPTENLPPGNLVFLIDVSGSMASTNKLPLLKKAYKMLIEKIRPEDKVAIVVYAGAAGLVLDSTPGNEKITLQRAIDNLNAGGSTAGGAGIKLAYQVAVENFVEGGNNRVILATDGDFNVGASSDAEMERLIEQKRDEGVFLTVLGFGMGNYKDSKMEILADKGNGNYAYIDNILEAKKVLINEFGGTLFTIAKDVKIQVEFNPDKVGAYRLIGYENRKLNAEDFNDDKKDAGELGSGHSVTALFEIIPAGVESSYIKDIDPLKYQNVEVPNSSRRSGDMMTVKLRYKQPDGNTSKKLEHVISNESKELERTSDNFRWSAAVASFGMLLRDSEFKGNASYELVDQLARSAMGSDPEGYRAEFIRLVKSGQLTAQK